eukprot:9635497-Prorocentrum_lima.AAC.1
MTPPLRRCVPFETLEPSFDQEPSSAEGNEQHELYAERQRQPLKPTWGHLSETRRSCSSNLRH